MDVVTGVDLGTAAGEAKLWAVLESESPMFVSMSPVCKAFSQARVPNWGRMDPQRQQEEEERGLRYVHLCMRVAEYQSSRGRFFAMEHPCTASSWDLEAVRAAMSWPGVDTVSFDQCEFGLRVSPGSPLVSRKRTTIMSNSPDFLISCDRQCSGKHPRLSLVGSARTRRSEIYPEALVTAMATGIELAVWRHHTSGSPFCAATGVESPETSGDELANFPVDEAEGPAEAAEEEDSGDEQETRPPPPRARAGLASRGSEHELDPDLKREVERLHVNLGHPRREDFLRALRIAGARVDVLRWVRDGFRCDQCESHARPGWRRKAHLPHTYAFNKMVAIDLFYLDIDG
eukprot:457675-Pyramimonas_sp.AAC.1